MIGSRLDVPVVPVRIDGVDRVLPLERGRWPDPGRCAWRSARRMRLRGDDYAALARAGREAVRRRWLVARQR